MARSKKQPEKTKRGRPSFTNPDARRVVLPRTYVEPATLAYIRADGRPAGRVIDEMKEAHQTRPKGKNKPKP